LSLTSNPSGSKRLTAIEKRAKNQRHAGSTFFCLFRFVGCVVTFRSWQE
jgi:hypothetical protein